MDSERQGLIVLAFLRSAHQQGTLRSGRLFCVCRVFLLAACFLARPTDPEVLALKWRECPAGLLAPLQPGENKKRRRNL